MGNARIWPLQAKPFWDILGDMGRSRLHDIYKYQDLRGILGFPPPLPATVGCLGIISSRHADGIGCCASQKHRPSLRAKMRGSEPSSLGIRLSIKTSLARLSVQHLLVGMEPDQDKRRGT
jgi:hypothetical protein